MQIVNHERMRMPPLSIDGMVDEVCMSRFEVSVPVLGRVGLVLWPEAHGHENSDQGDGSHDEEGRREAGRGAEAAGERVCQQPAGMRQRELCREERRAVFRVGGAAQQPTGGVSVSA